MFIVSGPPMPPMTSTTRAPPPFNPVYNNPLYPGGQMGGVGGVGGVGGGYDNMYSGQTRAGFNNIIPFNQTRNMHNMPGKLIQYSFDNQKRDILKYSNAY